MRRIPLTYHATLLFVFLRERLQQFDAQGFAILSQLRSYWPQTRSVLMNARTLERYREAVVTETAAEEIGSG